MRKVLILAAAIAAASCGGNSSDLSNAEAQSVASEISAALQTHEAVASSRNQLSFGGSSSVSYTCAGGGTLDVSGTLSVNCPSGLWSCATSGSLTSQCDGVVRTHHRHGLRSADHEVAPESGELSVELPR
ncbi:MAG: hypothetical protein E6J65_25705 [Deltaproteobacteria bacterium]|nr:MAG: hypothetical protein E6J65_25705 [Deltaproteobacteria bacterium]